MNGGAEAFIQDEEEAFFIVDKDELDYSLLEYYPLVYENTYLYMLEN